MIVDLDRFLAQRAPEWRELELRLSRLEREPLPTADLCDLERLFALYERAAADLARLEASAVLPEVSQPLAALVARAYGEIHETRRRRLRFPWRDLLLVQFPRAVRAEAWALGLAVVITLGGVLFGGAALLLDPTAKPALMPFGHLLGDPAERVAEEERGSAERVESGERATFSAFLLRNNARVGILCLALGMTFGVGTGVLLFYNGVILGAVVADYVAAGQSVFLAGWLLPHGTIEIPAILLAGQAGLVLGRSLLGGRADRSPRAQRLRGVAPRVLTLAGGFVVLLVWAAVVEAFLSQTHQPVIPYAVKIAVGLVELVLLGLWLGWSGRTEPTA